MRTRQSQRRRALRAGGRVYRRWGRLAVFVTPTWVSGALRVPRNSFLIWNGAAAIASTMISVFGAYAVASTVFGHLSVRQAVVLLAAAITASAWPGSHFVVAGARPGRANRRPALARDVALPAPSPAATLTRLRSRNLRERAGFRSIGAPSAITRLRNVGRDIRMGCWRRPPTCATPSCAESS